MTEHGLILPAAPQQLLHADGQPQFGRFSGHLEQISWQGLHPEWARSALWRRFHHKRWRYIALATEQIFCGIAIVDLGWACTAFGYVFERASQRELASFSQDGLAGLSASISASPMGGAASHFSAFGKRIDFQHLPDSTQYRLQVRAGKLEIDALLDADSSAPALLAVGRVDKGSVHATQKSAALALSGQVRCADQCFELAGGVGSFDYSNGLLARDTAWRWASAQQHGLGFNLQQGYFGAQENALWLDGLVYPLGPAHFKFDAKRPLTPWEIWTEDGLLQLQFLPEGARQLNKNLGVAISRYIQPIGCFSGVVKAHAGAVPRKVEKLLGVTEDHFSRW